MRSRVEPGRADDNATPAKKPAAAPPIATVLTVSRILSSIERYWA
jgi:hypothetical protein